MSTKKPETINEIAKALEKPVNCFHKQTKVEIVFTHEIETHKLKI
jgi:siroheme synthase (precorrin-2 oxidase/ferrochelatase)